jgi:hypothetical protein
MSKKMEENFLNSKVYLDVPREIFSSSELMLFHVEIVKVLALKEKLP